MRNYGRKLVNTEQEVVTKTIPKEKKSKTKGLSEEALQVAEERRQVKSEGERQRYTQLNTEVQRIARRDKKAFLNEQWIEENNRMERPAISSKKPVISRKHFI